MNQKTLKSGFFPGIDVLKGLLVLLVFLGHITTNVKLVYIIYSFHMPLFIGVSGFLMSRKTLDLSFFEVFKKLWNRMILPWMIAEIVYFGLTSFIGSSGGAGVSDYFRTVLSPNIDHLWYVIGMVCYVYITVAAHKILKNQKNSIQIMLALFFVISFISKADLLGFVVSENSVIVYGIYRYFKKYIRLRNLFFYALGIYLRDIYNEEKLKPNTLVNVVSCILFAGVLINSVYMNTYADVILFFALNICFLYSSLSIAVQATKEKCNGILAFIGLYSYPIYLYHLLARYVAKFLFEIGSVNYYVVCCVCFVACVGAVRIGKEIPLINRYLFGSTSKRLSEKKN